MKIKLKLKEILEEREMTTYQLSKITGVKIPTLENWTNERSLPRLDSLVKIAHVLGICITDMYEVTDYELE